MRAQQNKAEIPMLHEKRENELGGRGGGKLEIQINDFPPPRIHTQEKHKLTWDKRSSVRPSELPSHPHDGTTSVLHRLRLPRRYAQLAYGVI